MESCNMNILNLIYIALTLTNVVFGGLITVLEDYLPVGIRQWFPYGKFNLKDRSNRALGKMEMPRYHFKHFYVFAFVWSVFVVLLILRGFVKKDAAPEIFLSLLDLMAGGRERPVKISSSVALVVAMLMTMQCTRRFYESNFTQTFSNKSKMNRLQYLVGYIHYFGAVLTVVANTEGFVRGTLPSGFFFTNISLLQYLWIFVFYFSWMQQYKANLILINLRKYPKTDNVVAVDEHLLPYGGFFELVSTPHMFFEMVMYTMVWFLLFENITNFYVVTWVVSNQLVQGILTHRWYKNNFANYPKDRRAIVPFIL